MWCLKEGVEERCLDLLIRTGSENSSSLTPEWAEMRKKQPSPPVGQHSSITHFKIKSETGFWQAYFLRCQESHNRPFFLDKALKMLGDSDVLSHKTVQILHTHSCWCPCSLFWKQYYIFAVVWQKERNILTRVANCWEGGWRREASSDSGWLASGLVASEQGWEGSFQRNPCDSPSTQCGHCNGAQSHDPRSFKCGLMRWRRWGQRSEQGCTETALHSQAISIIFEQVSLESV